MFDYKQRHAPKFAENFENMKWDEPKEIRGVAETGLAPGLGLGDVGSNPATPTNLRGNIGQDRKKAIA